MRDDPRFERDGANLLHEAAVALHTAALGGPLTVPTLDGDVRVRVTAGAQPGDRILLSGKGLPLMGMDYQGGLVDTGRLGDIVVSLRVVVPKTLSARQKELLEEFGRLAEQGEGGGGEKEKEKEKAKGRGGAGGEERAAG